MIYLDNAATTLRKPENVVGAIVNAIKTCANAGRGGHSAAMQAADILFSCREAAADLFCVDNPEKVVFTLNATHALNIAIQGIMRGGGHCVISGFEHNSVVRPLYAMREEGVTFSVARSPLFDPKATLESFKDNIGNHTKCVVCTHISNVFGYILPIYELDELCYEKGIPLIIDAAQSAGCVPIHMDQLRATKFICAPGHKGLYGPQGTGLLVCRDGAEIKSLLQGGTGSFSSEFSQPSFLPDRHESGTQNIHGVAGLSEGIHFILKIGEQTIFDHEARLISEAADRLRALQGIELYEDLSKKHQAGVLSFTAKHRAADDIAYELGNMDIAVRGGLHCAPLAHQSVGTHKGTVRISVSWFNTEEDITALVNALKLILKN